MKATRSPRGDTRTWGCQALALVDLLPDRELHATRRRPRQRTTARSAPSGDPVGPGDVLEHLARHSSGKRDTSEGGPTNGSSLPEPPPSRRCARPRAPSRRSSPEGATRRCRCGARRPRRLALPGRVVDDRSCRPVRSAPRSGAALECEPAEGGGSAGASSGAVPRQPADRESCADSAARQSLERPRRRVGRAAARRSGRRRQRLAASKARSWADWKRSSGLLLEAVPHDPLEARRQRPVSVAAGPAAPRLRIAAIVSAPTSRP